MFSLVITFRKCVWYLSDMNFCFFFLRAVILNGQPVLWSDTDCTLSSFFSFNLSPLCFGCVPSLVQKLSNVSGVQARHALVLLFAVLFPDLKEMNAIDKLCIC